MIHSSFIRPPRSRPCQRVFLLLLCLAVRPGGAADSVVPADWHVPDAPYRVRIQPGQPPGDPAAGWLIELPEFGATRPDARDVILLDPEKREIPLDIVWRGEGRTLRLLAESLPEGKPATLYFGKSARRFAGWKASRSLQVEIRRRPGQADCTSFAAWQAAWKTATATDGTGFVPNIFLGENPFGPSDRFLSHFTGLLRVPAAGPLTFYTLSNQQSYLLVDRKPVLAWKENRESTRDSRSVVTGTIDASRDAVVRVDYHHAMGDGQHPGMVLGWKKDGKYETIPIAAWIHPGRTEPGPIEHRDGRPAPLASVQAVSYLGYADEWYVEARAEVPGLPDGWVATWLWPDGQRRPGKQTTRLLTSLQPVNLSLALQSGDHTTTGRRVLDIPRELTAASIHDKNHLARFLDLLAAEDPASLPEPARRAGFLLAKDFAPPATAAPWAAAWLKLAKPGGDAWISAQSLHTRWLARGDANRALAHLRALPADARTALGELGTRLELELLACRLQDPGTPAAVAKLQTNPDAPLARHARVRLGDYLRLSARTAEARAAYQSAADISDAAARKGPTLDKAAALALDDLIQAGRLPEARSRFAGWEADRPLAKLDADQLLWSARIQILDGDWSAAARDLESSQQVRPNSPEEIEVKFWLARSRWESGRRDEARALWQVITRDFPRHERAAAAKEWLAK